MAKSKMVRILGIAVSISLSVLIGQGRASRHWEFAGWYGGGAFPNVAFDPNTEGRVYLVSDVAGIWRSGDLGEKWSPITEGLTNLNVSLLEPSPSDPRILYAGTAAGLFRSVDGGATWGPCDNRGGRISFKRPANYRSVAVSRKDPARVAIGTESGVIYISGDYGEHWKGAGYPKFRSGWRSWANWFSIFNWFGRKSPVAAIEFDRDEKGLYVALGRGLYYYSIEERSWERLHRSPNAITDFFILRGDTTEMFLAGEERLSVSKDGGVSWTVTSAVPRGIAYRVVAAGDPGHRVMTVVWRKKWHGGIYRSDDGGATWRNTGRDLEFDARLNPTREWKKENERFLSLKVNPFDPEIMLASSGWGVFRSDDGGRHWKEKINGAPNTVGSDIHIAADGSIFAATMDNGLLMSADGGKTYETLFPKGKYNRKKSGHVWRVISDRRDPGKVIATSSPWNDRVNQVVVSKGGLDEFVIVRKGLPGRRPRRNTVWEQGYPRAIAVDPKRPHIIYLGIDGDDGGGLFVSGDGGWHWRRSRGQPWSKRIYNGLVVDPTDTDRLFWGAYDDSRGGVYLSGDRGSSWKRVFGGMTKVFDLAVDREGRIYAAGYMEGPAVFRSADHGKSWSLLKRFADEGSAKSVFVFPEGTDRIAVSTDRWSSSGGKIFLSRDRGETWEDITGDLPNGKGAAAMVFDSRDSYLYIIRYAGSVYKTGLDTGRARL